MTFSNTGFISEQTISPRNGGSSDRFGEANSVKKETK